MMRITRRLSKLIVMIRRNNTLKLIAVNCCILGFSQINETFDIPIPTCC